jgi:two-component system KDP operon response regulator KdpE
MFSLEAYSEIRLYALVAEPDSQVSESIAVALRNEGFEVEELNDSAHVLAHVMENPPNVVVMAEDMPPIGGMDPLPSVRRLTTAPIIVTSTGGDVEEALLLLQGADACLRKPLNLQELLARVRALLRRSLS